MAISLAKGQPIVLAKQDSITQIVAGLQWDARRTDGDKFDADISAFLLGEDGNVIGGQLENVVFYNNLRSADGAIVHSGDNRTGDGDDEVISVSIPALPGNADSLVLTINSFTGQSFANVANARCRILNKDTGEELAVYNLTSQGNHTAIVIGALYKHGNDWKFRAIGELANGRTARDLQSLASQLG